MRYLAVMPNMTSNGVMPWLDLVVFLMKAILLSLSAHIGDHGSGPVWAPSSSFSSAIRTFSICSRHGICRDK